MCKVYRELPENYELTKNIDFKKNKHEFFLLNILAIFLFILVIVIIILIKDKISIGLVQLYLSLLGAIIYTLLHEAVHVIFFKINNKAKISFKFHGFALSVSTPGLYFTKTHFLIITLAPFIVFNLVFLPLLFFVNEYWFSIIAILFALHISGCSGDLYVTYKLLFMPKDILIEDYGIGMNFYKNNKNCD